MALYTSINSGAGASPRFKARSKACNRTFAVAEHFPHAARVQRRVAGGNSLSTPTISSRTPVCSPGSKKQFASEADFAMAVSLATLMSSLASRCTFWNGVPARLHNSTLILAFSMERLQNRINAGFSSGRRLNRSEWPFSFKEWSRHSAIVDVGLIVQLHCFIELGRVNQREVRPQPAHVVSVLYGKPICAFVDRHAAEQCFLAILAVKRPWKTNDAAFQWVWQRMRRHGAESVILSGRLGFQDVVWSLKLRLSTAWFAGLCDCYLPTLKLHSLRSLLEVSF